MNKWVIGVVALVVILVGGYFAAKAAKHAMAPAPVVTQKTTVQPTATPVVSPTTTTASPAAMQAVVVSGNEFAFAPATIMAKKGQEIKVTFKNIGKYPHNFTLTDLNVQTKTIQPGEEDTVTFTPTKAGTFTYVCTVPGHADRGMKGTLTVE